MKKYRSYLFILLLGLLLPALRPVTAEETLTALINKTKPAVIYITVYDSKGEVTTKGTGFFISDDGRFVTNRHVLFGGTKAEVETSDGKEYTIKGIESQDREGDLVIAVLNAPAGTKFPYLKISRDEPQVGDRILVVGNPLGLEFSVSDGIVSALREVPGSIQVIQITAPISPGSSGSPVLNTRGEVVGVATFQLLRGQNINFAIPAVRISLMKSGTLQSFEEWSTGKTDAWGKSAEGLYHQGLTHILADDYENAIDFLKQAIDKNPLYAEAYFKLGYAYGQLKQYDEALQAFKKTLQLRPDDVDAVYNIGVIYGRMNKPGQAIKFYKQAIQMKPDYLQAYYNMGIIYSQLGEYQDAREMLEKAVDLKPDYASAHYNLGLVYARLKKNELAIKSYKQAIRINPDDSSSHYNLGVMYHETGNSPGALSEYKILKTLNKELADKLFDTIY